jgi:hypothetical protein
MDIPFSARWSSSHSLERTTKSVLRRRRSSWLGRIDAETLKSPAQRGEGSTQPSIDVKYAGERQRSRNLSYRPLVLKTKREQQAIGGIQLLECSTERGFELLTANTGIGLAPRLANQLIRIDFVSDKIFQPPSCLLFLLAISVMASRASVPLAEVIEDKSPSDDNEPRREFYVGLGDVCAESAAAVFAESF